MKRAGDGPAAAVPRGAGTQAWHNGDERFQKIIEHAPMAMAIVGLDGTIEYINRKAIEVFGYRLVDIPTMDRWWIRAYPDEDYRREVVADWMGRVERGIAAGREITRGDYRVTCKDGTLKTVGIFGMPVAGKVFVMFDDITERRQMERQLQKSEQQFRLLAEHAPEAIFIQTRKCFAYLNAAALRLFGAISKDQLLGQPILERVHADDHAAVVERIRRINEEHKTNEPMELRYLRLDGSMVDVEVSAVPFLFEKEHGALVFARDISARKQVERQLRESERRFSSVLNNSRNVIYRLNLQTGHFEYISPSAETVTGFSLPELMAMDGATALALVHPDDLPALRVALARLEKTGQGEAEYRQRAKDGTYRWLANHMALTRDGADQPLYRDGNIRDISARKLAELALQQAKADLEQRVEERTAALQDSERWFRELVENTFDAINVLRPDGTYLYASPATERINGYPRAEFVGGSAFSIFHPDELAQLNQQFQQLVQQPGATIHMTLRLRHRDGTWRWVEAHATNQLANPVIGGVVINYRDITERKQAEAELQATHQALHEGEMRFRTLFEQAGVGVALVDRQTGRFVRVNQKCCTIFGYTTEELLGLTFQEVTHADDIDFSTAQFQKMKEGRMREFHTEKRYAHKSGRVIWALLSVTALWLDDDKFDNCIAVIEDITQRKLMEQHLEDANTALEKQAAQLRELASELTLAEQRERQRVASVLHDDLQQLLISARYHMAGLYPIHKKKGRQTAAQVEALLVQSIECSRTLSGELSPPILQTGGLLPALEWLASWMEQKHGLEVKLVVHVKVLPRFEAGSTFLFQAVRELLLNAVKHARVKTASIEVLRKDQLIRIVVADQGVGFNPTQLKTRTDRISGLGLLSIRDRLDLLGGQLEIESAPGAGSRFTLTVPAQRAGADEEAGPAPAPKRAASAGSAHAAASAGADHDARKIRILVVDDHAVVRESFVQLLNSEADIEVVGVAADGEEAIERTHQLNPDIVTMDVNMRGMSGIEATKRIHAELPQVRVIGLSMFEESGIAESMRQAGAVDYLTKSSPAQILIETIRAVARAAPAGLSGGRVHGAGAKAAS
jgi:PAS domain S-box-containing protein